MTVETAPIKTLRHCQFFDFDVRPIWRCTNRATWSVLGPEAFCGCRYRDETCDEHLAESVEVAGMFSGSHQPGSAPAHDPEG